MKLGDYLARKGLSRSAFGAQIGVSHAAIVRYVNGSRRPSWEVMERIERITEGKVRPNDFLREAA